MDNATIILQGSFPGGKPLQSAIKIGNNNYPGGKLILQKRNENQSLQRNSNGNAFKINKNLLNLNRQGTPLPKEVLQKMGSIFNTDFSSVRIHTGDNQAESIGALAFTTGNDIYFAQGRYNPHTTYGQRLLGHELTHVVQQRKGRVKNPFGNGIAIINDQGLEAEAERMGQKTLLQAKLNPGSGRMPGQNRVIQKFSPVTLGALIATTALTIYNNPEIFKSDGFWELERNGQYQWHEGRPDRNRFVYSARTYKRWRDIYSYPVFIEITIGDFTDWLQDEGRTLINFTRPDHTFATRDTYRYYWFNSANIRGLTFGFGANLHHNGILGSSWLQGGPPGIAVNRQNNPIDFELQRELRLWSNHYYGTNFNPDY